MNFEENSIVLFVLLGLSRLASYNLHVYLIKNFCAVGLHYKKFEFYFYIVTIFLWKNERVFNIILRGGGIPPECLREGKICCRREFFLSGGMNLRSNFGYSNFSQNQKWQTCEEGGGTPQNFFLAFTDQLEKQIIIKKNIKVGQWKPNNFNI